MEHAINALNFSAELPNGAWQPSSGLIAPPMMESHVSTASRKRRHSKACTRCRRRKIRCDLQHPICGSCSTAGARCIGYDSIRGVEKPRSTISHLESEAARLEIELGHLKNASRSISDITNTAVERLAARVARSIVEPSGVSRRHEALLPLTSSFFLSPSPVPFLSCQAWSGSKDTQPLYEPLDPMPISAIPRHVIDIMLKHYCEIYRPLYPAIEEAELVDACERAYTGDTPSNFDFFCVYITLAISTSTLVHRNEKQAKAATRRFWASSLVHLKQVGLTASYERLQALQLLVHFAFLNPTEVDCERCAAAATRLCLQLGLHHEPATSMPIQQDLEALNNRRRLFWNSCNVDAAIHAARCRPFLWPTDKLTAKFPEFRPGPSSYSTSHFWTLRQIECEITTVLYYPSPSLEDDGRISEWRQQIQQRLTAWYQTTRQSFVLAHKVESHEVLFHAQMLRLNRPSPRCPEPTMEMREACINSSLALIKDFGIKDGLGQLFYSWHAAGLLVESGVCLLASILTSMESVAEQSTHLGGQDVEILLRYMNEAPILLWKLARHWPQITLHASSIEAMATAVCEKLRQWSTSQSIDLSSAYTLKKQLNTMGRFSVLPSSFSNASPASPQVTGNEILSPSHGMTSGVHFRLLFYQADSP
ncbi:hypothetical protein GQ53DRAFT_855385 [Thozetella sp. PMI_491]|nr:hypothetical protein GQ53DRAFT_855385 [Thozetella sp. PMI_491]